MSVQIGGWMKTTATFDDSRRYRYTLTRRWATGDSVAFVMLNPSTADEMKLDPTVRRCIGFARAWGHAGILVLNLFAFRSTDPAQLWSMAGDPVGATNDEEILDALDEEKPTLVVAAWGAWSAKRFLARERAFRAMFEQPLYHLGLTKDGHPRHPLYLRRDLTPTLWERPA